jgi:HSP20 family protein
MLTKYVTSMSPSYTSPYDLFSHGFDSMFMPSQWTQDSDSYTISSVPKANVYFEDESGYTIELAAPGYSREDFLLNVENGVITVGLISETEDEESRNVRRKEWSYSNFKRSFTLPENINLDQISASYIAGILNIDIPVSKNKNTAKRTISIK